MGNGTINILIIVNYCKDQGVKISTVAAAVADVFSTKLQQKRRSKKNTDFEAVSERQLVLTTKNKIKVVFTFPKCYHKNISLSNK